MYLEYGKNLYVSRVWEKPLSLNNTMTLQIIEANESLREVKGGCTEGPFRGAVVSTFCTALSRQCWRKFKSRWNLLVLSVVLLVFGLFTCYSTNIIHKVLSRSQGFIKVTRFYQGFNVLLSFLPLGARKRSYIRTRHSL